MRELARLHDEDAINTLAEIMQDPNKPARARVAAADAILDRGWGRPPQAMEVYDPENDKPSTPWDLSKLTNDELDRVKRVEPFVVDNTPALVIHILTNSQLIEGMMLQQCKREMKEVLRVIRTHRDELGAFKIYTFSGFKAIEGAGGYAEPVLLFEYRFTPEDFDKIDWDKLKGEDGDIKEMATHSIEP